MLGAAAAAALGSPYTLAADLVYDEARPSQSHLVGGVECGSYLIISQERSGTTTFCSDLNREDVGAQHSIKCAYELLNFADKNEGQSFLTRHQLSRDFGMAHPRDVVNIARRWVHRGRGAMPSKRRLGVPDPARAKSSPLSMQARGEARGRGVPQLTHTPLASHLKSS